MIKKSKIKLSQVIKNNNLNPLIILGNELKEYQNKVEISANIDERFLNLSADWQEELTQKSSQEKAYCIIIGIEDISLQEQEKFVNLLKNRRAGNYKLPNNAMIIILANNENKISDKIKSLSLMWNA